MILIRNCAEQLKVFLEKEPVKGLITKFRIYVRLGFRLEAYIFVYEKMYDEKWSAKLKEEFLSYCKTMEEFCKCQKNDNMFHNLWESKDFQKYWTTEKELREYCKFFEFSDYRDTDMEFYVRPESELKEPYFRSIAACEKNIIDFGPRFRFDSFLKETKSDNSYSEKNIPVVTFYSYKGGMGRTTTLMGYAIHLAENRGKNVVVIDCDLEAPGYLNFFNLDKNLELLSMKKNGLVEFFCDSSFSEKKIDIRNYVVDVDKDTNYSFQSSKGRRGNIWVVPAGNLNETTYSSGLRSNHRKAYLEGLAKMDLADSEMVIRFFEMLFQSIRDAINPDVILIDSRTGFNDIFGNAVYSLSKSVVGFFGRSRQTEPGFMNLLQMHKDSGGKFSLHIAYSIWPEGDNDKPADMNAYMTHLYNDAKVSVPEESFIHRNKVLEYVGSGDDRVNESFREKISEIDSNEDFADYKNLFESMDKDLFGDESKENGDSSNTASILQTLESFLEQLLSKKFDVKKSPILYRYCFAYVFDKAKILFYGKSGCGKTALCSILADKDGLQQLNSSHLADDSLKYYPVKIPTSKFESFMLTPDADLHWDTFSASYDFWQFLIWETLLTDDDNAELNDVRRKVRTSSKLWESVQEYKRKEDAIFYIPSDGPKTQLVEQDLFAFDRELSAGDGEKNVVILFDDFGKISDLRIRKNVVSSLVKFWQMNSGAFDHFLPKIFLNDDSEHIATYGFKKSSVLKSSCVDMNWDINELCSLMYASIADNASARHSLEKLAEGAEWPVKETLENILKPSFKKEGKLVIKLSHRTGELEKMFFGKKIAVDGQRCGSLKNYAGRLCSSGNSEYVHIFAFALLYKSVVEKARSVNVAGGPIIPSLNFEVKDIVEKVSKPYFAYLCRTFVNDVDLRLLDEIFIGRRVEFATRILEEREFDKLVSELSRRGSNAVNRWRSCLIQSGIVDRVASGIQIKYCFAPVFWNLWNLREE